MGKQIAVIVWSVLYGEILAYVVSALTGLTFDPKLAAIIPIIAGLVLNNVLNVFISDPKAKQE
ncbi:YjzD family protein [Ligilactobacillus ceti]|uniref:DUF2929 domain-containing protein n=1 Tax=Ligilactobacillus ceti DSM 22408 TaxID=1122146 RepID=A0A0R2KHR5_9LACO|nr:YjzD family protein [Ligilactobacillus ceti]KRN88881.1 hypothetical protein IV53_GL000851 [Ligilactobacillus ceti DSM 22408]